LHHVRGDDPGDGPRRVAGADGGHRPHGSNLFRDRMLAAKALEAPAKIFERRSAAASPPHQPDPDRSSSVAPDIAAISAASSSPDAAAPDRGGTTGEPAEAGTPSVADRSSWRSGSIEGSCFTPTVLQIVRRCWSGRQL